MDKKFTWFYVGNDVPFETTFKYWFALMWQIFVIPLYLMCIVWFISIYLNWFGQRQQLWIVFFPIGVLIMATAGGISKYKSQKNNK